MPRETQLLTPEELAVYEAVATDREMAPDALAAATGLDAPAVDTALSRLEELGMITNRRSRAFIGPNDWDVRDVNPT